MIRLFLIWLVLSVEAILSAQQAETGKDSLYQSVRLGIMVQGRGAPLYSWFGHAGIILSGPPEVLQAVAQQNGGDFIHEYNGEELLFDYGNFDASNKNFVLLLPLGRLNYYKIHKDFRRYKEFNNRYQKRGLDVYWLNLYSEAKRKFVRILFREIDPVNRLYKYDFYFDNCVTRIRDQLDEVFDGRLKSQITGQSEYSVRQILRREIGDKFWGLLLLEYLQGPQVDQKYTRWDSIFFPSYMPGLLEQLQVPDSGEPLLAERENIFPFRREELERLHTYKFFYQNVWALMAYVLLSLVAIWLYCLRGKKVDTRKNRKNIWEKIIYYGIAVSLGLVLAALSGVLWVANVAQSFDVVLGNILALLGSPFLSLQAIVLLLMVFKPLRRRAGVFMLWNWRIHFYLALFLPIGAWLYSLILQQSMQEILLPWLSVLPILLAAVLLPHKK